MTREEEIIYEQYVYQSGPFQGDLEFMDYILNLILNIKELNNSPIKILQADVRSDLLSLSIEAKNPELSIVDFSLLYSVTDSYNVENRSLIGQINITKDKITFNMDLDIYKINKTEKVKIYESFFYDENTECFSTVSSYSNEILIEKRITKHDFNKVDKFKKEFINNVKSRGYKNV